MKQIKTIYDPELESFDDKVNAALADGWEMTKRACFLVGAEHLPFFYAELEKEIITEAEQTCENCKHYSKSNDQEPCASCDPEAGVCYWEAAR